MRAQERTRLPVLIALFVLDSTAQPPLLNGRVAGNCLSVRSRALDAWRRDQVSVADRLRTSLEDALRPMRLEIIDESARHHGHAGARPEGETHFRLLIVSEAFSGRSRIERQRMVHAAAAELLRSRIHALSIQALTPEEAARAAG